jgi:hypothetical protein
MSICGLHGRAFTDPYTLDPYATCDRCGIQYNMRDLVWQYDWRGDALMNLRILVCTRTCVDEPFEFNRPIILPPDPMPVLDARPGFYAAQEGPPPAPGYENTIAQEIDQA